MRITKKWLRDAKEELFTRVKEILSDQTDLDRVRKNLKEQEGTGVEITEREALQQMVVWAIERAIPSHMCD